MLKIAVRHTSRKLEDEVRQVKSLLISFVGTDSEGAYNPSFVKYILDASREKPTRVFRNAAHFLEELTHI